MRRALLVLALAACAEPPPPGPTPGPTPGPVVLELADDFEGDAIADFWLPGDHGSGRYAPGAVAISTAHARSGRSCVAITVRTGDVDQPGDPGVRTERAELDSGKHELLGCTVTYRFAVRIEPDFPIADVRLVIAQWKQQGLAGSPVVAQRFRAGRHDLTVRTLRGGERRHFALPDLEPGRWHDMEYRIRWSTGDDGLVRVWMNGEIVADHAGRTASPEAEPRLYHKLGLYRDRWPDPMTIRFDAYALTARR